MSARPLGAGPGAAAARPSPAAPAAAGPAASPVRVDVEDGGALWRVRLCAPKGNVLDAAMVAALAGVFEKAAADPAVKAICLAGEGAHFSFGASVAEHLPGSVAGMLARFHGLFRTMLRASVPTLAAVRGQCLGGGLELAAFCTRVVAAPDARLGQPEIALGVFAPVASLLLQDRVGLPRAEDLCLTGRVLTAPEALAIGLVDEIADDPEAAACGWARQHLLRHSASSLRFAARAVRARQAALLDQPLAALERLYLDGLMASRDANEGLQAFLDKRPPAWRNA